jgi:hypothetical protein
MTDTLSLPLESPRRLRLDWIFPVLLRPRQAMAAIAGHTGSAWAAPLLLLSLTAVLVVLVAGPIKNQAALSGQVELPPEFEYYPPEMQAQFMKAMEATQSPVFIYVFPALVGVSGVWIGWLVVSGVLNLALTLLGGRGATGSAMNLVAWAGLPFAVRDLVRLAAMLFTKQLIGSPGLSGFAPPAESGGSLFLVALLALIDIYLVWHIALLVTGIRAASGLPLGKALSGAAIAILLVISGEALLRFLASRLGSLTIVRPFF